jgi:solute:Na+ symporter, SSS family
MTDVGQLQSVDYFIMIFSLCVVCLIAFVCSRWMKDASQIFSAGDDLPWWLSGVSQMMTAVSAGTWAIWGSIAFVFGWVGISLNWLAAIATAMVALFFAGRWKRARCSTAPQWFKLRYNEGTHQSIMGIWLVFMHFAVAMQLYAVCLFISHVTPLSLGTVVILTGVLITLTTTIGGLWAVTVTDFVQAVILNVACLVLIPLALIKTGGWSSFIEKAPEGFFSISTPNALGYGLAMLGPFLLVRIVQHSTQWSLVQRYISVPDERVAKKSAWLCAVLFFICPVIWLFPLLIFRTINPDFAMVNGEMSVKMAERAYAQLCLEIMPAGIMGLMMAAMYAATFSALNSEFNVMASVYVNDVYLKFKKTKVEDRKLLKISKCCTVLIGLCVTGLGLLIEHLGGAVQYTLSTYAIMTGPMGIPLLWGLFSKRTPKWAAAAAAIIGVVFSTVARFALPAMGYDADHHRGCLMGTNILVPVLILVITDIFFAVQNEEKQQVEKLFERFDRPFKKPLNAEIKRVDLRVFGVIGICLFLQGLAMLIVALFVNENRFWILLIAGILLVPGLSLLAVGFRSSRLIADCRKRNIVVQDNAAEAL